MGMIKRMMRKEKIDKPKYALVRDGKRYLVVTSTSRRQKRAKESMDRKQRYKGFQKIIKSEKLKGLQRKHIGLAGAKINRAALNSKIGLHNPGGIISSYFRNLAIDRNLENIRATS